MNAVLIILYCLGLAVVLVPTAGALTRCLAALQNLVAPPQPAGELLRHVARLALEEYDRELRAGGEPDYPQWADELLRQLRHHAPPSSA